MLLQLGFPKIAPEEDKDEEDKDMVDGLSVDLEDYYHVEAFAQQIPHSRWSGFPSRVRQNTHRTLALLERTGCRATFFVLGWVAYSSVVVIFKEQITRGQGVGIVLGLVATLFLLNVIQIP